MYAQESKIRIAVIDLDYNNEGYDREGYWEGGKIIPYKNYAMDLTSSLTTELVNTKKYIVIERSRIEQVIKELGLQSTQNASARAAEIGNLLGVRKIITGEYLGDGKVSLRLIDVESGGIEAAITVDKNTFYDVGLYSYRRGLSKIYEKDEPISYDKKKYYTSRISISHKDKRFPKMLLDALLN